MKPILYLDYDSVIVDTVKQIVNMYNDDFCLYPDWKKIYWDDINSWDFKECTCASKEYIHSYFNQERFFSEVQLMDEAYEGLGRLAYHYDIYVVTMGDKPNLNGKKDWITRYPGIFKGIICCEYDLYKDKSHINMTGSVFVDDRVDNLINSNAKYKICFGSIYPWNIEWYGDRAKCWNTLVSKLINYKRKLEEGES